MVMKETEHESFWKGNFGDEYTDREPLWRDDDSM